MATKNSFEFTVGLAEGHIDLITQLLTEVRDLTQRMDVMLQAMANPYAAPKQEPVVEITPDPAVSSGSPLQDISAPTPAEDPFPIIEEPVKPEPKEYTLEQVRARIMSLCRRSPEVKANVKSILNKYAETVPNLKPEHYAPLMEELEVLG